MRGLFDTTSGGKLEITGKGGTIYGSKSLQL
jgi:hypothetical protein